MKGAAKPSTAAENAVLNQLLTESGERDRLKNLVSERLSASDWHAEMKKNCVELLRSRGPDPEKLAFNDIAALIAPRGRALVPAELKQELRDRVDTFAEKEKSAIAEVAAKREKAK